MERPQQKRLKLDNSPKVPRRDIELLPNEILMNIFSNLSIKELLKCAQVSKKFRQISHDGSFWKCVNLYNQRVSCQFVAQLLHLGTEYLNLLGTTVLTDGNAVIPRKNNLKYLNLAVSSMEDKFLVRLLRSSVSLEKLSLAGVEKLKGGSNRPLKPMLPMREHNEVKLRMSWYIECLLPNARMLTTLDLSHVTGIIFCKLNSETMEEILLNCVELKEANFEGQVIDAEFFANNLTTKIEKLNISSNMEFDGKQIVQLVKRCNNITELDLAGCDYDVDLEDNWYIDSEEFQKCLSAISENLSQSLVKLCLPSHSILCHEFLKSLPKLQNLWINNEDVENFDMKQHPHIVLNEGTAKIAYSTYEYFEPSQGFWEIKCTAVDFSKPQ